MNAQEFQQWMAGTVSTHYPLLAEYITNTGYKTWQKSLEDVDLADAEQVIRECFSGDLKPPTPYQGNYADWCAFVRQQACALRWRAITNGASSPTDWEPTYSCPKCLDSGYLTVVNPRSDKAKATRSERPVVKGCSVACFCSAGERRAGAKNGKGVPRYDTDIMCLISPGDSMAERRDKLVEFLANVKPKGYYVEFDEWSTAGAGEVV